MQEGQALAGESKISAHVFQLRFSPVKVVILVDDVISWRDLRSSLLGMVGILSRQDLNEGGVERGVGWQI